MAQTAIDLLFEQFDVLNSDSSIPVSVVLTPEDWLKLYLKFKAMEKEQIIKGYEKRRRILQPDEDGIMKFMSGEQYYKETYGGKDL